MILQVLDLDLILLGSTTGVPGLDLKWSVRKHTYPGTPLHHILLFLRMTHLWSHPLVSIVIDFGTCLARALPLPLADQTTSRINAELVKNVN